MDYLIDKSQDLADTAFQAKLHEELKSAVFIAAALDCSTKSRIREKEGVRADGKPLPKPLRSEEYPMGLPGLVGYDKERVQRDNDAAEFVLSELQHAHNKGVGSVRENPHNSLHWCTPTEVRMFATGEWWDRHYHACCLHATRRKSQRLRHDIEEIERWPSMQ